MIASVPAPSANRPRGLSQRLVRSVVAARLRLADAVLPMRGGHPALGYRSADRF